MLSCIEKTEIYDLISYSINYYCTSNDVFMALTFQLCNREDDLRQILALQLLNLRHTQSDEVEADQGFVTVQHNLPLLAEMNSKAAHVIAKDGDKVVGYALAMTRDFHHKISLLEPLFDLLDNLIVDGSNVGDGNYIIMGQVCIDYHYRGKGVFQGLYKKYFEVYKPLYQNVITDIAARNTRSLRAHLNVGFKEIHRYDEPGMEEWIVVIY